jgi:dienelactone hydrolase
VTVTASQPDPRGELWTSSATFTARSDGTLDLSRDSASAGTYTGTDPMGLIWSMRPADPTTRNGLPDPLAPTALTVTANVDGQPVCHNQVLRLRVPDGLTRLDVREHGLVGTLYRPADHRVLPGVLLLGGSEGGTHDDDAALLAAHGHAVLALAYYGVPGLPPTLQNIPLEYFGHALTYLRTLTGVHPARLAVIGASKGGEAALLVGATFPEVTAVISVVGSGLVTQGISQDLTTGSFLDIMTTAVPNWTYRGQPLPYLPTTVTPQLRARVANGMPVTLREAFEPALTQPDLVAAATIPVERINGPTLLISAEDDQGYGPHFHQHAVNRLAGRPFTHLLYPGAGHLIAAPPFAPTTQSTSPGPGVIFEHGGTPEPTARARADTWQRTLALLAQQPIAPTVEDRTCPTGGAGSVA